MERRLQIATGIVRNAQDQVLLMRRNSPSIVWEMPGGEVKSGEHTEAALARHLHEKLDVDVAQAHWLGQITLPNAGIYNEYHWFLTELDGTPQITQPDVYAELHYFPSHGLRRMMAALAPDATAFTKQLSDGEIRLES